MLRLTIKSAEYWDERKNEFFTLEGQTLELEHSLYSISLWEMKYQRPFFDKGPRTLVELQDYVRFMTLTKDVNPLLFRALTKDNIKDVENYMQNPMSATTIHDKPSSKGRRNGELVTSELIYYWMAACQIPFTCEMWNIHRLMNLIRIYNIKNDTNNVKPKGAALRDQAALNRARRAALNSKG